MSGFDPEGIAVRGAGGRIEHVELIGNRGGIVLDAPGCAVASAAIEDSNGDGISVTDAAPDCTIGGAEPGNQVLVRNSSFWGILTNGDRLRVVNSHVLGNGGPGIQVQYM